MLGAERAEHWAGDTRYIHILTHYTGGWRCGVLHVILLFIVSQITTNKYLLSSYLRSLPEQTSINQLSYYSPFSIHIYLLYLLAVIVLQNIY